MIDRLAALRSIIDHNTEPWLKLLCSRQDSSLVKNILFSHCPQDKWMSTGTLFSHKLSNIEQVAKLCLVSLSSIGQPGQAVSVFGDDKEVSGGLGADVAESQRLVVLIDDGGWDLLHTSG